MYAIRSYYATISCSDVHIALFDADHKHIQSFLGSNTKNKNGIVCNAFTGSCINCNHRIENDFSANLPVSELQCSHNKYLLYFPIGTNNKKKGYFIVEGIKYERINNKINIDVITSYSIHYTKLYEFRTIKRSRNIK